MYTPRPRHRHRHRVKPGSWRRWVLTTSQASIFLTSAILLLFTTALFISGCAIQQRTLREIRQGIKAPKPSPRIYLPDRFKHSTTELADGTVIVIEDEYHADRRKAQAEIQAGKPSVPVPPTDAAAPDDAETKEGFIGPARRPEVLTEREKNERAQMARNLKHPDPRAADQSPVSRAERRQLIKDELRRLSHVQGPAYQRRLW